ncbi:MAG: RlmE family RNA methyltransferase [Planctomycetota bacterium]
MSRRKLHDPYFKQAKSEGYAARSAFKLKQIQEARSLIRRGQRVLDLGCAPGSWLQVASELVGPAGTVVGLDLQPVSVAMPDNVIALVGDIREIDPEVLTTASGGLFDVIISDMAPKTTGHGDSERSIALCQDALALAPRLLKPTGNIALKVFEGALYPELLRQMKEWFSTVRGYKPKASRDVSREMYAIGTGFIPPRAG